MRERERAKVTGLQRTQLHEKEKEFQKKQCSKLTELIQVIVLQFLVLISRAHRFVPNNADGDCSRCRQCQKAERKPIKQQRGHEGKRKTKISNEQ